LATTHFEVLFPTEFIRHFALQNQLTKNIRQLIFENGLADLWLTPFKFKF